MKVALDSMIFIYLFEADPRFFAKTKKLFEKIESGDLSAVTSIISPLEVLSAPKLKNYSETLFTLQQFFKNLKNLEIIPLDWEITEISADLRRNYPILRTLDSIHLATAIYSKASKFITNDKWLCSLKIKNLEITSVIS